MKSLLLAMLITASAAHAITVDGFVYLSGDVNHAETKIVFHAISPSAHTDSTVSGTTGAFSLELQPGVYNLEYVHFLFAPYLLPNQALLFATTLPPVTLLPPISGALSGTLGPGDFQAVDSIGVDSLQTLTIAPGTRIFFSPRVGFGIRGLLTAIGTESDSIVFTKRYASADSTRGQIVFDHANSDSRMEYCVVEYGRADENYEYYNYGGGIRITECNPSFYHCSIRLNTVSGSNCRGGGVGCAHANPTFASCDFVRNSTNSSSARGSGLSLQAGSEAAIYDCYFGGNTGSGGALATLDSTTGTISHCYFFGNLGTGGSFSGTGLTVESCTFRRDTAVGVAGFGLDGTVVARHCLVEENLSYSGGMAVWVGGSAQLLNSTVVLNVGNAIGVGVNAVVNGTIVADSRSGAGIYFGDNSQAQILFCDIYGNQQGSFAYEYQDTANAPLAIGIIALTNANGDSCDTYYNIYEDPLFADTAAGDYHLTAGSPCIDAGDPALPPDPDGTVADIGAFYYPQSAAAGRSVSPHPLALSLSTSPNPFNASTRISFELPVAGEVKLKVYDVMGRLAADLVSGRVAAGRHEVMFDGSRLSSGVYFARLETRTLNRTQKMVLLK